jgi:hypothetical protein
MTLLFEIVNGNVNERDGRVALWSGEAGAPGCSEGFFREPVYLE